MNDYDAELQLHHEHFRAALSIRAADRVLDIGCGTGQSTREAALRASDGDALGVDIDEGTIARACELADREGVPNVRFEVGDAQAHPVHLHLSFERDADRRPGKPEIPTPAGRWSGILATITSSRTGCSGSVSVPNKGRGNYCRH